MNEMLKFDTVARQPMALCKQSQDSRFIKSVFMEDWFLEAVAPGAWDSVSVTRDGQPVGWLPFVKTHHHGFSACGIGPLARLCYPLVKPNGAKLETQLRHQFEIEHALIKQLPSTHLQEFILPDVDSNCLAWQAHGFTSRLHHSLVIDPGQPATALWSGMRDKTRNLIRRAQEKFDVTELDAPTFKVLYERGLEGRPPNFDLSLIERIAAKANGAARILAVHDSRGEIHAAVFFLRDAHTMYYFLTARDPASSELGANSLLVWTGMCEANAQGLRFDFDGITSEASLKFLQPFGGRVIPRTVVERTSAAYDTRRWLVKTKRRLLRQSTVSFT
jgi:hypothetical protein